jgi:uncharacterized membrane protein
MRLRRHTFHRISVREHRTGPRFPPSLVKPVAYHGSVACLDFLVVYLFTHEVKLALGFTVVSGLYTAGASFLHERFWSYVT